MQVNRDAPVPMKGAFPVCRECGHMHPHTPPGQCPIMLEKSIDNKKVSDFIANLTKALKELPPDKMDTALVMLRKTLQVILLKQQKNEL